MTLEKLGALVHAINIEKDSRCEGEDFLSRVRWRSEHPEQFPLMPFLADCSYKDLEDIESLMLFGRGDFPTYWDAKEYVKSLWGDAQDKFGAISYIYGKRNKLDEYMRNAYHKMRHEPTENQEVTT